MSTAYLGGTAVYLIDCTGLAPSGQQHHRGQGLPRGRAWWSIAIAPADCVLLDERGLRLYGERGRRAKMLLDVDSVQRRSLDPCPFLPPIASRSPSMTSAPSPASSRCRRTRRLLRARAWRRRRHASPIHGRRCGGLAERRIATLRYQFPYMERGRSGPILLPSRMPRFAPRSRKRRAKRAGLPLIAGGKSFGGRMTSQAQALSAMPDVRGLAFLGFPLHPAGKPSRERAASISTM